MSLEIAYQQLLMFLSCFILRENPKKSEGKTKAKRTKMRQVEISEPFCSISFHYIYNSCRACRYTLQNQKRQYLTQMDLMIYKSSQKSFLSIHPPIEGDRDSNIGKKVHKCKSNSASDSSVSTTMPLIEKCTHTKILKQTWERS